MEYEEIKFELWKKGWTPGKMSEHLKESKQMISNVLHGIHKTGSKTKKIKKFVCNVLKIKEKIVFPNGKSSA